jgi:hypothetical protein
MAGTGLNSSFNSYRAPTEPEHGALIEIAPTPAQFAALSTKTYAQAGKDLPSQP